MIAQSCPSADRWHAHLRGELPADALAELAAHLDACPACQHTVEALASDADSLFDVARRVGQDTPTHETALHDAILAAQAHSSTAAVSTNDFPFLDPPAAPGQLGRLGHYTILEVVGRGGMGIVLKALDERLQRVVAVKVLGPQYAANAAARQRFQREAKAVAAVSHDHVVPIYHVDESGGVPYLVMPLIVGRSLEERIEQDGPLPLAELLRIGMQVAAGLAAAHAQGITHRDIKPANILLENGVERVKITDFGLARAVDDVTVTQSGVIAGTPLYMSPEQARGEALIDARSDLFSLGSVLYAMATGRPPFRATGSMAVLKRVCDEAPRPIRQVNPDMPDWLEAIVGKLHAKWPGDRFQSAQELADLLGQHLAHLQAPRRVPSPAPIRDPAREPVRLPTPRSRPIGAVIVGIVLLAFCVLSFPVAAVLLMYGWTLQVRPMPDNVFAQEEAVAAADLLPDPLVLRRAPNQGQMQAILALPGWDEWHNPTGKYRINGNAARLTIAALPGDHDDNLIHGNFQAPRVLRNVQGDFSVTVKVAPFDAFDDDAFYVGGGLLVWHDQKSFVRYLIARNARTMGPGPHEHTRAELDGNTKLERMTPLRDDQRYLNLERRGDTIRIRWGADDKTWGDFVTLPRMDLPARVKVGVVMVTSVQDAAPSVRFEDFRIDP
jgi:regulation of enolase protein 1 (concanavalin A-like superfamily)